MKYGTLVYDHRLQRYFALYDDDGGGRHYLHCGHCFQVRLRNYAGCHEWVPTRIEYAHDSQSWYLIGVMDRIGDLEGLAVRS